MRKHFNNKRLGEMFNLEEYLPYHEALYNMAVKGFGRSHGTKYIAVNTHLCISCWKCVETCKKNVLGKMKFLFHKHVRIINAQKCTGCGSCERICPAGAIYQWQKPAHNTVEHLTIESTQSVDI